MKKCYNCGREFVKADLTKEHIPPRCFSDVYSDDHKKNRITVPCCHPCNNEFSKIDNELRDMIAVAKDARDGNMDFLEKGMKSIFQGKQLGKDFGYDPRRKQVGIKFDYELLEAMFLKCHKGIFYHKYNEPLDEKFVSQASQKLINDKHNSPLDRGFVNIHQSHRDSFIFSGHKEIFAASILAHKEGPNATFVSTENLNECFAVSSYLVYHDIIDCLVLSVKKGTKFYDLIKAAL